MAKKSSASSRSKVKTNEFLDMRSWLRCYLYFVFLICVSGNSLADTPSDLEKNMGGFAYPVICSHPSDLNFCFDATKSSPEQKACDYWLNMTAMNYQGTRHFEFPSTVSGSRCFAYYKVQGSNTRYSITGTLVTKNGLCPNLGGPPPNPVLVIRQGRWFPQELPSERCYQSCEYTNGKSFTYKHFVYTNGVVSEFKEDLNSRLRSTASFCKHEPEPIRDNAGEVTYESNCSDAVFSQFCDFINWFRNDSEMPEAPAVENKTLDIATHLKTDHVRIEANAENLCFPDIEFKFWIPFARLEVKQQLSFSAMCNGISSINGFLHVLYLLHAAFIIFRN